MFKRIYVHNFRCLENFELDLGDKPSTLLIGKNGSGKSTLSFALALLQAIARGTNRVGELVKPGDFFLVRKDSPMRFEVDVELDGQLCQYRLALELPPKFKEPRVLSETLVVAGEPIFSREHSKISVSTPSREAPAEFLMDWHMIALPIIQVQSARDSISHFKQWLARAVIIAPIPSLITGDSYGGTLEPTRDVQNLGSWLDGLISNAPRLYTVMENYLREILPDFWDVQNPSIGSETKSLLVQFRQGPSNVSLPFAALSDGEKCFFISALVLAANHPPSGPIFCMWDEPDSHLSIDEVGHFINALRRSFEQGGQLVVTSHNAEAIRRFSDENTLVLFRRSHLEPTRVKSLEEIGVKGDLIQSLLLGDIEL